MAVPAEQLGSKENVEAPLVAVASQYDPAWLGDALKYVVAALAAMTLIAAAQSAMLGLSRLSYSLATNRQIPSAVGRLHPSRSTPYVVIVIAALLAVGLVVTEDADFLVGIFAYRALLGLTIAHLAVCVLRYREPERDRPYRMPLAVTAGRGDLPLPSLLGAMLSFAAWVSVMITHEGARY